MLCSYCAKNGFNIDTVEMEKAQNDYWDSKDHYIRFRSENLIPVLKDGVRDISVKIQCAQMWLLFKKWFKNSVSSSKLPDESIFRTNISRVLGDPIEGSWVGIKSKEDTNIISF